MTTHIMSLTYGPKIEAVKSGEINQTIRLIRSSVVKRPRDKLILHTWEGRPYHSKWGWRFDTKITKRMLILIREDNEWFYYDDSDMLLGRGIQPHYRHLDIDELQKIAVKDGIDPPTFDNLCVTLMKLNDLKSLAGTTWEIITWDATELEGGRQ
jgi:hypothetical protein